MGVLCFAFFINFELLSETVSAALPAFLSR